jgi:hypothetical protein
MKKVKFNELIGKTLETATYHIPSEVLILKTVCGKIYQISGSKTHLYEGIQDLILVMSKVILEAYVVRDEVYVFYNIITSSTHVRLWWISSNIINDSSKFYELSHE